LPLQAASAQLGALQSPPAHMKLHVDPGWQSAFGQTEPAPLQLKLQVEPLPHATLRSPQSPPEPQLKLHVLPASQLALPLQRLSAPSHTKSQSAPGSQLTFWQLAPLRQS
jgi:hypothetical protein